MLMLCPLFEQPMICHGFYSVICVLMLVSGHSAPHKTLGIPLLNHLSECQHPAEHRRTQFS